MQGGARGPEGAHQLMRDRGPQKSTRQMGRMCVEDPVIDLVTSCKLLQEAEVVVVEDPDVVNPVLQHGDALDAETSGEARVALRVDSSVANGVGVEHPAPPQLQPPHTLTVA